MAAGVRPNLPVTCNAIGLKLRLNIIIVNSKEGFDWLLGPTSPAIGMNSSFDWLPVAVKLPHTCMLSRDGCHDNHSISNIHCAIAVK